MSLSQYKFKYLAVRPERVEGLLAIFSHERRVRGGLKSLWVDSLDLLQW